MDSTRDTNEPGTAQQRRLARAASDSIAVTPESARYDQLVSLARGIDKIREALARKLATRPTGNLPAGRAGAPVTTQRPSAHARTSSQPFNSSSARSVR
jgi:hypothetical protein